MKRFRKKMERFCFRLSIIDTRSHYCRNDEIMITVTEIMMYNIAE
jgi:hypothetical protein